MGGIDGGEGVGRLQNGMGGMAVGATGHLFRIAETVVLAVIAFHVGFDRHVEDLVALHHLFVAVALHADLGVEFPVGVGFRIAEGFDVMEVVAVVAGGGILIAGRHRLAVNRLAGKSPPGHGTGCTWQRRCVCPSSSTGAYGCPYGNRRT